MRVHAAAAAALLASAALAAGAAAANIVGSSRADVLRGTPSADRIDGRAGNDFLDGRGGSDRLLGGAGSDRIKADEGRRDSVACGPGEDVVTADAVDAVAADCEVVSRQISRDPYTNEESQHETEVEPDTFSFGSTVVAAFQVGRTFSGGAANTGFATSLDGGRTWRSGLLPELTAFSDPPGAFALASDPVVAYDASHGVWLISSLLFSPGLGAIVVSRSPDGLTWSPPVTVTIAPSRVSDLLLDKQWIACDNWATSPFRGSCYTSYSDFRINRIATQFSRDGGLTWSAPVGSPDDPGSGGPFGFSAIGPQTLSLPNGDVVVPFVGDDRMVSSRSTNGGVSFSPAVEISPVDYNPQRRLRAGPLPSAEIDGAGTIYIVWSDCGFRANCESNDLVVSRSEDGVVWSPRARVPIDGLGSGVDHEIPGLGVDLATSGQRARIALAYYTLSPTSRLDAGFVSSTDGARTWSRPRRLNAESMDLTWLPDTVSGRMVGDYISTSFAGGRAVSVFALASRPDTRLHESIFATVLPSVGSR